MNLVVVTCAKDGTVRAVTSDRDSSEMHLVQFPECPTCKLRAEFEEKLKALEQFPTGEKVEAQAQVQAA